jgi:3-deoxy-D-manno-octulosonic-acid transferase
MFNFADASKLMIEGGGLLQCEDAKQLAETWLTLLGNQDYRISTGKAAQNVADFNRGALVSLLSLIGNTIPS